MFKWTKADTMALIEVWGERLQLLKSTRRTLYIYKDMYYALYRRKIFTSPDAIRTKIHNMTQRYRSDKHLGVSSWQFYEVVGNLIDEVDMDKLPAQLSCPAFSDNDKFVTESDNSGLFLNDVSQGSAASTPLINDPCEMSDNSTTTNENSLEGSVAASKTSTPIINLSETAIASSSFNKMRRELTSSPGRNRVKDILKTCPERCRPHVKLIHNTLRKHYKYRQQRNDSIVFENELLSQIKRANDIAELEAADAREERKEFSKLTKHLLEVITETLKN